jgi:hypothetical protein
MLDSERELPATAENSLQKNLDLFVFFHLGADAKVSFEKSDEGISVSIEHARVHSFSFVIDAETVDRFNQKPEDFESFLLTHLTDNRRHS